MIVSEQNEVVLNEDEEFASLEDDMTSEEEEVIEQEEESSPQIPDKFKDKSVEDVVKSYQELESEFGRRNNELGEMRRLTDELLQLQLKDKPEEPQQYNVDVDTLLDNPTDAIKQVVAEQLKPLQDNMLNEQRNQKKATFENKHPDWQELMNDPNFVSHVQSSPVRLKMFQEANANYDYDVADELFSMYKQIHGAQKEETQEKVSQKRSKNLKAAKTETGSTGAKSTKVFKRNELLHLRMTNPAKYESMEDEIMRAYAEGRVR